MSEMIERVARALASHHWYMSGNDPEKEGAVIDRRWRNFEPQARAAIEAMCEPTEAMLASGSRSIFHSDKDWESNACWRAMIDAALK